MVVLVVGIVFLFASVINSTGFRDPNKKDLVNIESIGKDILAQYPFIAIMVRSYSRMTYGRSTSKITESLKVYSVVLLNKTYRSKIKIGGFDSKEEAKEMLIKLSEKYSKEIVKYNPQVSETTISRR